MSQNRPRGEGGYPRGLRLVGWRIGRAKVPGAIWPVRRLRGKELNGDADCGQLGVQGYPRVWLGIVPFYARVTPGYCFCASTAGWNWWK
jgi:hypothetical protein